MRGGFHESPGLEKAIAFIVWEAIGPKVKPLLATRIDGNQPSLAVWQIEPIVAETGIVIGSTALKECLDHYLSRDEASGAW